MGIIKGKKVEAQRVVIYGPEGIGKSTLASKFPNPIFIDIEDGTGMLDITRYDQPILSFEMLNIAITEIVEMKPGTIVLDGLGAMENLIASHICSKGSVDGIEGFGYGKGYTYLAEAFGKFLNKLNGLKRKGIHVVLVGHSILAKFEQPDELGSYDRYTPKLEKKTNPLLKEWADAVLFMNYKTLVFEDEKTKKKKASGATKILYTEHHACWDAKNRWGLDAEVKAEYTSFAHCIPIIKQQPIVKPAPVTAEPAQSKLPETIPPPPNSDIPDNLLQLMKVDKITDQEVMAAVGKAGYYPANTPIKVYDEEFVKAILIGKWSNVSQTIFEMRKGA